MKSQSSKFKIPLTPSQKQAVFHVEGPLLVVAGPGSGKTAVITYRIAALIDSGISPHNICAITFTNKAADEMRQRTRALGTPAGPHISTFHSLCVRILRRYADKVGINPNFSIYDQADQARCIKQAVKDCELDTTNFPPARMLDAISTRLKNNLIDVDAFKVQADDYFTKNLARIYDRYQHILTEHNALDFDDLLVETAFLLRDCSDVCSELSNRFKFLLIDEYQDTNRAQYIIARAFVSEHNNICATGDPDQSIYRWRGADIRNILAFEKDWPDATVVKLEENFRSTPNILEVADSLIAVNTSRKPKKLIPTRPSGQDVIVDVFEDENEEADAIAQQIKQFTEQGISLNDIAVFYRVNSQSRVLEEAFIRDKILYQVVRGVEFYRRKEIRDLLAYLKILVNPEDEIALLRIINTPSRGIGKTTIDRVRAYAVGNSISLFEALNKAKDIATLSKAAQAKLTVFFDMIESFKKDVSGQVTLLAERVLVESGLEKSLKDQGDQGRDALENINELLNAASQYEKFTEQPSLLDYLQQIALFSDTDTYDSSSGSVALMTLHAAKGLEFDNVFIIGVEHGLLPHERSNAHEDRQELEEERRLFFVGITRAKARLHISHARYRTIRGQQLRTIPSQFLYELGPTVTERNDEEQDFDDDIDLPEIQDYKFKKGQIVLHKTFGRGIVKNFVDMGENSIVEVEFSSGRTKSLMLKYANLSKV
ncbi:MAG: UvrD-helicase domain-containing protein [Phycisphaerae bacterium]|nr:UvrD-helicase domain-containing protein [Phycisphaerae bacterium]NIP54759.1 UvrD-helicase domain-containing protein [Phycisphaerae bacterium]NIS50471.1 UvrD-helicase domain-containing protein [Phycisphaerae bacterium]NIU11076.1 UvrD-helicase domain-containing protein [Phycisphaerae bacterium]NIU58962.1 UvrD-helicase domain-containing protein [Phycisphaerae bacterium]